MADPTLYLFDGHNLLYAGGFADRRELRDALASFVASRGARGVLVFDGSGTDETVGPLDVRFAQDADALVERLASERREHDRVLVVSSDWAVRATSGQEVGTMSSARFLGELTSPSHREDRRSELGEQLDERTRAALERLRRGAGS